MAEPGAAESTLEALGEAAELARPGAPAVVAVGPAGVRDTLAPLASHGAGRLVWLRAPGPASPAEAGRAVGAWLRAEGAAAPVVLLPHTRHGAGAAAHLTAVLDAALAPDAVVMGILPAAPAP